MSSEQKAIVTFQTIIFSARKNATGIEITAAAVAQLGAGKRPAVLVTLNCYTYRNTIAVMGDRYLIGISETHRNAGKIAAGNLVDVTLTLDTEPRPVEILVVLQEAFLQNPYAATAFEKLSYSKKQGIVLPILNAKTKETRRRRVEKAVEMLGNGIV